jgi:hypothetical protein
MNRIERRLRVVINPVSTAATRWWCHSATRYLLIGHGLTAEQRRSIRRARGSAAAMRRAAGSAGVARPSPEQMRARTAAIDELLRRPGAGQAERN